METDSLIADFQEAYELASQFTGGYSERFGSAEEFSSALGKAVTKLKDGDAEVLKEIDLWFLPTSDWDDFVKLEGLELGQRISDQLRARN